MTRKMKDSGIEWIGEIPEDWKTTRIAGLYSLRNTKVSDMDYPPLSVTMKGVVPQLENAAKTNDHNNRKLVKKNDFVINSRSDRRGSCGISKYDGSVSLINTVLSPRDKMDPEFYNLLFTTPSFSSEFYKWGNGIVDDLWTTNWNKMKDINVPRPDLEEQHKISTFLNSRLLKINRLIEKTSCQIQILEDYKKSVITEAVTKGLDKNVEMKDSGIEWIGEIPKHWEVKRLKNFTKNRQGGAWGKDVDLKNENQNIICIRIADFDYPKMTIRKDREFTFRNYTKSEIAKYTLQKGDILVEKSGGGEKTPVGRTIIWNEDFKALYANFIERIRLDRDIVLPMYAQFCFYAFYGMGGSNLYFNQTTGLQNLDMSTMLNKLNFPIPKISEQNFIIDFLNKKTATIDEAIAAKEKQLEILEEYKKSLIYEYVTGKKEVEDVGTI